MKSSVAILFGVMLMVSAFSAQAWVYNKTVKILHDGIPRGTWYTTTDWVDSGSCTGADYTCNNFIVDGKGYQTYADGIQVDVSVSGTCLDRQWDYYDNYADPDPVWSDGVNSTGYYLFLGTEYRWGREVDAFNNTYLTGLPFFRFQWRYNGSSSYEYQWEFE